MVSKSEQTLSYRVHDEIRRRIVRGIFKPGEPLREMVLEKQLGVSRAPVREALRLLIPSGLVEYKQWRGFRVKKYTPENIRSLYRLRAAIEGMLVQDLQKENLESLVKTLRGHNEAMKKALFLKQVDVYFEENLVFHQRIIEASENEPMIAIINNVTEITLPARYALIMRAFPNQDALKAHDEIIEGIRNKDIEQVKSMIEYHILDDLEEVTQSYRDFIES